MAAADILRNPVKDKLARGKVVASMTVRMVRSIEIARIDVGHFFLAMKPNLFASQRDYRARMDALIARMRAVSTAEGFDEILIPGEPEDRIEAERRTSGIPYAALEVAAMENESKTATVQPLVVSDRPISG